MTETRLEPGCKICGKEFEVGERFIAFAAKVQSLETCKDSPNDLEFVDHHGAVVGYDVHLTCLESEVLIPIDPEFQMRAQRYAQRIASGEIETSQSWSTTE